MQRWWTHLNSFKKATRRISQEADKRIVKVVLRFVPLTGVTEVSLDDASDQIIFVVNCVGKPLTRTRIGS